MNKINYLLGYIGTSYVYSIGRSCYYLSKTEDSTYVGNGKNVSHPVTISSKIAYTCQHIAIGPLIFPFCVFNDFEFYFLGKMGIREAIPPVPFGRLRWKDEKKDEL